MFRLEASIIPKGSRHVFKAQYRRGLNDYLYYYTIFGWVPYKTIVEWAPKPYFNY